MVIWGHVLHIVVFWGTLLRQCASNTLKRKKNQICILWSFLVKYGKLLQSYRVSYSSGVVQYTWRSSVKCLSTLAYFTLLLAIFCCTSRSSEVLNERICHFTLFSLHSNLSLWLLNVVNEYFLVLHDYICGTGNVGFSWWFIDLNQKHSRVLDNTWTLRPTKWATVYFLGCDGFDVKVKYGILLQGLGRWGWSNLLDIPVLFCSTCNLSEVLSRYSALL